jgi:hypothetical protein
MSYPDLDCTQRLAAASCRFFADAAAMNFVVAVPPLGAVDAPAANAVTSAVDTPAADAVESAIDTPVTDAVASAAAATAVAAAEGPCR